MHSYNPEKDFVTAQKVNTSMKHYHDAIAIMNAKFAAERAVRSKDSAYGSEPCSPGLSATSDSTAPDEVPIDLMRDVRGAVEKSVRPGYGGPVVIAGEHYDAYQMYLDGQNGRSLRPEWFQEYKETEEDDFVLIDAVEKDQVSSTEDLDNDSGVELTPPHSDDESELVKQPPQEPIELPSPQFKHLANVSFAVPRDVFEKHFTKQATPSIPLPKACPFGTCSTACLSNPCYPIDQLIDDYKATTEEYALKTTRIYLDITGQAALISYPRSKSLRLLAQRLNEDVITDVVDMSDLDNEHAKYRFEIDISRFVRSRNVLVYSTSPITGFYRDLEDSTEELDACLREQHELTTGPGVAVEVANLFLGTAGEFEGFAEEQGFTKEQREVVIFCEEEEDYLDELCDFGVAVPMHNELEEESEYTQEEQLLRQEKAKGFEECRKIALGTGVSETKDAVVLYCAEREMALNFLPVYRCTSEEDGVGCEAGVRSLSGSDLLQKTVEPADKDQVVQRVVTWLGKDDGHYESMASSTDEDDSCNELPRIITNEEKPFLSATTLAKYNELIATIEPALQAQDNAPEEEEKTKTIFTFTLTNPTSPNAAEEKKHIYLSTTNNKEIHIHFSPPTQLLTITSTNPPTTCHEFNPLFPPSPLTATKTHLHTFSTGNCVIYSALPMDTYTLDYSLPEVKDAPRHDKRKCQLFLRARCGEYVEWAPWAVKYKMNLGSVGVKGLKREERVLGVGVSEDGEEEEDI
ncbi:hypothetical protein EG328_002631 [Venturia inaequalis]|uniref:Uncharacterized protein n=1 Tax=Venturia inaequalis TaxID=5025 RepID=A0A8H3YWM1_VENIN|nr:hypothetical protein EG328_002631 [Venturia inaequalis]